MKNKFIELNRTFTEQLPRSENQEDENWLHFMGGEIFNWSYLINEYRVVILSEAGSGKTEEIRNVTQQIRANNKFAFFLRLEHLYEDFEIAFEEGTFEEFKEWKASTDEAWVFLDSVDESRLRNPKDFELAIKKLALALDDAKQRVHIFITGRVSGWRPITDLVLCDKQLPYIKPTSPPMIPINEESDEMLKPPHAQDDEQNFRIFSINDLSNEQVEIFAKANDVLDISAFREDIDRADAEIHTRRPLDLDELVAFWKKHKKIGNRLELMRNSINSRLVERDENRAQVYKISSAKLLEGAMKTAAASLLANEPTLQIPDGTQNTKGFSVRKLLINWDETDCSTLLSRPIFDKAIYGTVRFYHRSVREYLAAEWFAHLLRSNSSRRKLESLFFTTKYGIPVIVPTMRPILPWLALLDEKVRTRLIQYWPEVLFEGGDPSELPMENRRKILQDVCDLMVKGEPCRSIQSINAIQRFADPKLADVIKDSLFRNSPNNDLQWFLLRMIWQGRIYELIPEAKQIASDSSIENNARVAAVRAVISLGTAEDLNSLKSNIGNAEKIDRYVFAEMIDGLTMSMENIEWFFQCLDKVSIKQKYHSETLTTNVEKWVHKADINLLPQYIVYGAEFLNKPPFIERRHCEISEKYIWLTSSLSYSIEKLIQVKDPRALSKSCLSVLSNLPKIKFWDPDGYRPTKIEFNKHVSNWIDLKVSLFWHIVEQERAWAEAHDGAKVTFYGQCGIFNSYVSFTETDFEFVVDQVRIRPFLDDKLVALSLAHALYLEAGKPLQLKNSLKTAALNNPDLESKLQEFLHPKPPTLEERKLQRQNAHWRRKAEQQQKLNELNHSKFRRFIQENPDTLRDPKFDDPTAISTNQHHLMYEIRDKNDNAEHNWKILISSYGEEVARAFRDGAEAYWRKHHPKKASQGGDLNKYLLEDMFGLVGLNIEANEVANWSDNLSEEQISQVFGYALFELNGFPKWFPKFYSNHRSHILEMVWTEIYYELTSNVLAKQKSSYLLHDVNYSGEWMWDDLAPRLLQYVQSYDVLEIKNLHYVLNILQGAASISDDSLAELAASKFESDRTVEIFANWFAVWVGVNANEAIKHLEVFLDTLQDKKNAVDFSLIFITQLIEGRRGKSTFTRDSYKVPEHLKKLYILMNRYIKMSEDTQRANNGVFSPTLRDDAQDARSHLYAVLENIPGKVAFEALVEIAMEQSENFSRPWFMLKATNRASKDADIPAWSIPQIIDFNNELESTPSCHQELFNLAELRVLDLKDDLENGDSSIASLLIKIDEEVEVRKYIGNWCRELSKGRYSIVQEEQLADDKRPDFRWLGNGFDGPVPMELKLADKWTGPQLFERLRVQLNEDYLRDNRSSRGLFLLVNRFKSVNWEVNGSKYDFSSLVTALQEHWQSISPEYPKVEDIKIIGIDLTIRAESRTKKKKPKKDSPKLNS